MGEGAWLIAFVAAQRSAELVLARRNTARLKALGAVEFGAAHYPLMVALHAAWLATLAWLGHDSAVAPAWLALFMMAQVGRVWVLASLGARWSTRVLVLPGTPPVARGPYRRLRHPNYLVVLADVALVPLALGLPIVALVFSGANLVLLARRIRVENRALAWAAGEMPRVGSFPSSTLANR